MQSQGRGVAPFQALGVEGSPPARVLQQQGGRLRYLAGGLRHAISILYDDRQGHAAPVRRLRGRDSRQFAARRPQQPGSSQRPNDP
jgi:hypothetical protein